MVTSVADDAYLIAEALRGSASAFGQLVRKYQRRLFQAMIYVAGSREDANDVVQNAFVRAYTKLHRYHAYGTFYAWLYRIAVNEASHHRARRRPTLSLERSREAIGAEPADPRPEPAEQLEQERRCRQIHQAVEDLSHDQRTVLKLRAFDGCRYDAIAQKLGLSVSTVRGRLHMARSTLRRELATVLSGDG